MCGVGEATITTTTINVAGSQALLLLPHPLPLLLLPLLLLLLLVVVGPDVVVVAFIVGWLQSALVAAPHDYDEDDDVDVDVLSGSCHCHCQLKQKQQQQQQQQATSTQPQQQRRQQHELTKRFSREILHKPNARGSGKSNSQPSQTQPTTDNRRSEKSQLIVPLAWPLRCTHSCRQLSVNPRPVRTLVRF